MNRSLERHGVLVADKEIVNAYLEGKKEAYNAVVGWIQEVISMRLWNHQISPEEIVSITTCKLLVNLRGGLFEYRSPLKIYVQRITRFTIIDAVRNRKFIETLLERQQLEPSDGPPTPLDIVESEETAILFDRILNLLDEKCRQLWIMILDESLSYKEIAKRMKITEGSVKTRVFRCKEAAIAIRKSIT